jgi:RimJ/RimL family protein N-acetyltransferase
VLPISFSFTFTRMQFDIKRSFENDYLIIQPLVVEDFERLYAIALDPKVWEQHPNPTRYKREVFENYFKGAMEQNAFIVLEKGTDKVIGSTRYYAIDTENKSVIIGYTFVGLEYWGKEHNRDVKKILINYAFQFFDKVIFHIGVNNLRSQKAIAKIGARSIGEIDIAYYGELPQLNFIFEIIKSDWKHF